MRTHNSESRNQGLAQNITLLHDAMDGDKASIKAISRKFAGGYSPLVTVFSQFFDNTDFVRELRVQSKRKFVIDSLLAVYINAFSRLFSKKHSLDFNREHVQKLCNSFIGFLQTGYSLRLWTKTLYVGYSICPRTKKVIRLAKKDNKDVKFDFGDVSVTFSYAMPIIISRFDIFFSLCNKYATHSKELEAHVFTALWSPVQKVSDCMDGIARVGSDIDKAADQLGSVDNTLQQAIRTVTNLTQLVLLKGTNFQASFEQLQRELVSACTFVTGPCKDILMSLVFAMMRCFTSPSEWKQHVFISVTELCTRYCVNSAIEKAVRCLVKKINDVTQAHTAELIDTVWMAVKTVLTISSCGMVLSSGDPADTMLSHITRLDNFTDSVVRKFRKVTEMQKVFDYLRSYCDTIFEFVYKLLSGEEYKQELDESFGRVYDWVQTSQLSLKRDIRGFLNLQDEHPVSVTDLSATLKDLYDDKVEALYTSGQRHLLELQRTKDGSMDHVIYIVKAQLQMLGHKCKGIQEKYLNKTKGFRKEPLHVVLCGPPGHGKSTLLEILYTTYFLCRGFTTEEELTYLKKNEIYVSGGQKFENGYKNQMVFVFDDAGQKQTAMGDPDEYYEKIVHYKNSAPANMSMAALEDKNMHMTSDLIMTTTNSQLKDKYSLVDFGAFERRVDFKILVLLDPEVLKFSQSKKRFDYTQDLCAVARAFRNQQQPDCKFTMGVCDSEKIKAKYGDDTDRAYRFILLDQTSTSGIEPMKSLTIGGKIWDTSKMFGIEQFEEMFCAKQVLLNGQKDTTDNVVKNYANKATQRITSLMHAEAHVAASPREYCWKGAWCSYKPCDKIHPLGVETLGQALSIKFGIGAFIDPVTLQLKSCIDGSCDQSTPHRCINATDLQISCYSTLNLSGQVKCSDFSLPVSAFTDLVVERSADDNTIHEKKPADRVVPPQDFLTEMGGFSGLKDKLTDGFSASIGPIFERARLEYQRGFSERIKAFKESIFGMNFKTFASLVSMTLIVFAGAYYYFSSAKIQGEGHVMTKTQKERKKLEKKEKVRQMNDGVFFEPSNEHAPRWTVSGSESNMIMELNKTTYAVYKTRKGSNFDGTNGQHEAFANVTCLKGTLFVTAGHVLEDMQAWYNKSVDNILILKNDIRHVGVAIVKDDLKYYNSPCGHFHPTPVVHDLGFFTIDQEVFPPHRNLTKYLLDANTRTPDISLSVSGSYAREEDGSATKYNLVSMIHCGQPRHDVALTFRSGKKHLCTAYTMSHSMAGGQSGAHVCLVSGTNDTPHIFGVYNGGNSEIGVVTRVTQQDVVKAELALGQQIDFPLLDVTPGLASDFYTGNGGEVTFEGTVEKAIIGAKNSSIVPSGLHGKLHEVKKKPAHLTTFKNEAGEKINPRRNAERKYFTANAHIERYEAEIAVEGAVAYAARGYRKDLERIYTTSEAILGVLEETYIDAIASSSSSGHEGRDKLLSLPNDQLYAIKKRIAEKDGVSVEAVKLNNRCFKEIQMMFDEAQQGLYEGDVTKYTNLYEKYEKNALEKFSKKERIRHLWEDQLKDETRPFAKVDIGKTRMFNCAADVCYLIMVRKYFMGFAAMSMEGRVDNGMTVGINPYNEDWDHLYNVITFFGLKQLFAGDFGAFDSSHNYILNSRMVRFINKYFYPNATDEENHIRNMLWLEIVNSVHINEKDILTWVKGMPSGNPLTTLINCLVNNTSMRLCWNRAMRNAGLHKYANSESFNQFVRHVSYGDDSITAVHPDFSEVFNQEIVSDLMPLFGFEYTDEQKQDKSMIVPFRDVSNINFLKRVFRKCPRYGYMVGPIEKETILGMNDYVRDRNNVPQQTIVNAKNALREASLHDQEFFEDFYKNLRTNIDDVYPGIGKTLNGNYWDQREIIRESQYTPY